MKKKDFDLKEEEEEDDDDERKLQKMTHKTQTSIELLSELLFSLWDSQTTRESNILYSQVSPPILLRDLNKYLPK